MMVTPPFGASKSLTTGRDDDEILAVVGCLAGGSHPCARTQQRYEGTGVAEKTTERTPYQTLIAALADTS